VASTILAVDDSVTMRKVLEITFAGLEFRCVTVPGPDAALEKVKTEKPALVIADLSLEGKNGYDLCKAVKAASPTTPVLILSSKHNPYDPSKGSAAGADDHIDKPYDTQSMIDKVRKLLAAPSKEAPKAAAPTPAPAAQPVAAAAKPAAQPVAAAAAAQPARAKTLLYNPGGPLPGTPAATPAKPEPAPAPAAKQAPVPTPAGGIPAQPRAAAVAAQVNGAMTGKLEEMGLNAQQIEAILQLSRDVVERVVWEVVPSLAETIIREEIARLTK
jgi:DNA-binding response OmpR family regulator